MNNTHKWKLIGLMSIGALVVIAYLFCVKNKESDVVYVETTYPADTQITVPMCGGKFETDTVSDSEKLYTFGSILRIDDLLVDDQYYAYLWQEGGVEKEIQIEFSNEVNIKVFKEIGTGWKLVSVDIETFRGLIRNLAKDLKASKVMYKIRIKDNLIKNVEQVTRLQ